MEKSPRHVIYRCAARCAALCMLHSSASWLALAAACMRSHRVTAVCAMPPPHCFWLLALCCRTMVERAEAEQRVVLTRDRTFVAAAYSDQAFLVQSDTKQQQVCVGGRGGAGGTCATVACRDQRETLA